MSARKTNTKAKAATRTRRPTQDIFEVVDELPENPPRKERTSPWEPILGRVLADVPAGKPVAVKEYPTVSGATGAVKTLTERAKAKPKGSVLAKGKWTFEARKTPSGGSKLFVTHS